MPEMTEEYERLILELRDRNLGPKEISFRLPFCTSVIIRVLRKHGYPPITPEQRGEMKRYRKKYGMPCLLSSWDLLLMQKWDKGLKL